MTKEEYFKMVQQAWKEVDKQDKEAVHNFNIWRNDLLNKIDKESSNHN